MDAPEVVHPPPCTLILEDRSRGLKGLWKYITGTLGTRHKNQTAIRPHCENILKIVCAIAVDSHLALENKMSIEDVESVRRG